MKRSQTKRRPQSVTVPAEWVGGAHAMPTYVNDGPEPYRPDAVMWIADGVVLAQDLARPGARAEAFVQALERALAAAGTARPTRLRVADAGLAESVRASIGAAIEVVVAPTPEIDEVLALLGDFLAQAGPGRGQESSYLEDGRVAEATVAGFFRAAARLYAVAPWNVVGGDDDVLALDCETLGLHGAVVSIIGGAGQSFGAVLFDTIADFEAFCAMGAEVIASDLPPSGPGVPTFSINFERRKDLPGRMQREIARHRWPVAGPGAYPVALRVDADGAAPPLTERDAQLAWVVSEALARFFEAHAEHWDELLEREAPTREVYTLDEPPGAPSVAVTLPHPEYASPPSEADAWLEAFLDVEQGRGVDEGELRNLEYMAVTMHDYVEDYGATPLAHWSVRDLEAFLLEWFPRKISTDPDALRGAPAALGRYFRWLGAHDHVRNGAAIAARCNKLEAPFQRAMRDPSNFGMAKSVFASMTAMGFDPTDPAQLNAGVAAFNARFASGALDIGSPVIDPVPAPTPRRAPERPTRVRWQPAPGETPPAGTAPCPCGSGKRYRKCCLAR